MYTVDCREKSRLAGRGTSHTKHRVIDRCHVVVAKGSYLYYLSTHAAEEATTSCAPTLSTISPDSLSPSLFTTRYTSVSLPSTLLVEAWLPLVRLMLRSPAVLFTERVDMLLTVPDELLVPSVGAVVPALLGVTAAVALCPLLLEGALDVGCCRGGFDDSVPKARLVRSWTAVRSLLAISSGMLSTSEACCCWFASCCRCMILHRHEGSDGAIHAVIGCHSKHCLVPSTPSNGPYKCVCI